MLDSNLKDFWLWVNGIIDFSQPQVDMNTLLSIWFCTDKNLKVRVLL